MAKIGIRGESEFFNVLLDGGHRQATVQAMRGTGILGPYLATSSSYSNNGYEKITQKNFPFQKSHLKLALNTNSLCGYSDVYDNS